MNFMAKELWTLVRHRLCPINRDNVLSLDHAALVAGIMAGYDIDMAKLIAREIYNQEVSTDIVLAFIIV